MELFLMSEFYGAKSAKGSRELGAHLPVSHAPLDSSSRGLVQLDNSIRFQVLRRCVTKHSCLETSLHK